MKTIYYYPLLIVLLISFSCQEKRVEDNLAADIVHLIPMPNKIKVGQDSLDISSGLKLNFKELNPEVKNDLSAYLKSTALNLSDCGVEASFSLNNSNYADSLDESYKIFVNGNGIKI